MVSVFGLDADTSQPQVERNAPVSQEKEDSGDTTSMDEDDSQNGHDEEMRLASGQDEDQADLEGDDEAEDDHHHHQQQQKQRQRQHSGRLVNRHKRKQHGTAPVSEVSGTNSQQIPVLPPRSLPATVTSISPDCDLDTDGLDEEQLKRILSFKRLSEGNCNKHLANGHHWAANTICRKNSLHLIGESLPPVTEGEPMRHMSHHMSQNMDSAASSSHSNSASSGSLRRHLAGTGKRNSQDDFTTSCSSSVSLDNGGGGSGLRSPTRRRSSTVSQCSSVLSEGTRLQLNFDLSPDLAPDSSILEANAVSPCEFERPASPEPSSLDSLGDYDGSSSFDMRPMSRMSDSTQFNCSANEDESSSMMMTDADRSDQTQPDERDLKSKLVPDNGSLAHLLTPVCQVQLARKTTTDNNEMRTSEISPSLMLRTGADSIDGTIKGAVRGNECQNKIVANNLEQIITHVREVTVSSGKPESPSNGENLASEAGEEDNISHHHSHRHHQNQQQQRQQHHNSVGCTPAVGQKRAHTPFGANIQRQKATHIEFEN